MGSVVASVRHKVLGNGLVRKAIGSPPVVMVGKHVAPRADLLLQRLTGGRLSVVGMLGSPMLILHTVGRRSGLPRATPLLCTKTDAGFIVVGSNWGQAGQPAWALNLRAEPAAEVEVRGRRRPITGRVLEGAERAAAWDLMVELWPSFDDYVVRADGRELWVFLLEPAD